MDNISLKKNICEKKCRKAFPRIGIFIVSFNASNRIRETLDRIPFALFSIIDQIFVFDDCSTDDTPEILSTYKLNGKWKEKLVIFHNSENQGYGGNQKLGYRYAIDNGFDYVVMLHGDGQYAPEMLPEIISPIFDTNVDAIFGSRMLVKRDALKGGMPIYKWLGNQVLTAFENAILGLNLSEYHTGLRLYSTNTLKQIPFEKNTDDFHFDTQIIVQLRILNSSIKEVPISTFYGDEKCHVNGLKYAALVCMSVIHYRLHQLHLVRSPRYVMQRRVPYSRKASPFSSHEKVLSLVKPNGTALDLGASDGLLTERLLDLGVKSIGVDIAEPTTAHGKFQRYILGDLENFPQIDLGNEKFDSIILADVIEHIRNADRLLAASRAHLKQNGSLIVSTPNIAIWFYRLSLLCGRFNYGPRGILDETHVKLYTLDTIKNLLKRNGYTINSVHPTSLPFELVFESIGKSKILRIIDQLYHGLCLLWPRMFAYQFVVEASYAPQPMADLVQKKNEGQ